MVVTKEAEFLGGAAATTAAAVAAAADSFFSGAVNCRRGVALGLACNRRPPVKGHVILWSSKSSYDLVFLPCGDTCFLNPHTPFFVVPP